MTYISLFVIRDSKIIKYISTTYDDDDDDLPLKKDWAMRPHGLYKRLPLVRACEPQTSVASDLETAYTQA